MAAGVDAIRERGNLEQGLPRDRGIGVVEQAMHGRCQRRIRREAMARRSPATPAMHRGTAAAWSRARPPSRRRAIRHGLVASPGTLPSRRGRFCVDLLQEAQRQGPRPWSAVVAAEPAEFRQPAAAAALRRCAVFAAVCARPLRSAQAAAPGSPCACSLVAVQARWRRRLRAGRAGLERRQGLAQHQQRRFQIGDVAPDRRRRARGQRGLEKQAGLLEGRLDVVAIEPRN